MGGRRQSALPPQRINLHSCTTTKCTSISLWLVRNANLTYPFSVEDSEESLCIDTDDVCNTSYGEGFKKRQEQPSNQPHKRHTSLRRGPLP